MKPPFLFALLAGLTATVVATAQAGTVSCVDSRNSDCRYSCAAHMGKVFERLDVSSCRAVDQGCPDSGSGGAVIPVRGTKRDYLLAVNFGVFNCRFYP